MITVTVHMIPSPCDRKSCGGCTRLLRQEGIRWLYRMLWHEGVWWLYSSVSDMQACDDCTRLLWQEGACTVTVPVCCDRKAHALWLYPSAVRGRCMHCDCTRLLLQLGRRMHCDCIRLLRQEGACTVTVPVCCYRKQTLVPPAAAAALGRLHTQQPLLHKWFFRYHFGELIFSCELIQRTTNLYIYISNLANFSFKQNQN